MNFFRSNKSLDIQGTLDWLFTNPASPYYCGSVLAAGQNNGLFNLVLHGESHGNSSPTQRAKDIKGGKKYSHSSSALEAPANILVALLEKAVNRLLPTGAILIAIDPTKKNCVNSAVIQGCADVNMSTLIEPNCGSFSVNIPPAVRPAHIGLFPFPRESTIDTQTLPEVYSELASLLFQLLLPSCADPNSAMELAWAIASHPVSCLSTIIHWCKQQSDESGVTIDSRIPYPSTYDTLLREIKNIATRAEQSLHSIISSSLCKVRYFGTKSDRNAFWYFHPLSSAALDWSANSDGRRRLASLHPELPTLLHTTLYLSNVSPDGTLTCILLPGYQLAGQNSPTLGVLRWISEFLDYLLSCARSKSEPNRSYVLPTRKPKTIAGYPPLKHTRGICVEKSSSDRSITVSDVCGMLIYYNSVALKYVRGEEMDVCDDHFVSLNSAPYEWQCVSDVPEATSSC
jgi:hypothetical protein